MEDYNRTVTEACEKYGSIRLIFSNYVHGIFTFVGINEMKTLVLCVVVDNYPDDFVVQRDSQYQLSNLPFKEVLVYNPDNELVERYEGC